MAPTTKSVTMADFAAGIADLAEVNPEPNILIYGDPGSGKTCLVGGLPNALFLACDPSWVALKAMPYKLPAIRIINDYETLSAGIAWLEDGGYQSYEWVIFDGGSVMQSKMLRQFAREAWEANPAKRVSADQPDKPDYFKSQNALKSFCARLMDIPVKVVITAHVMHGEDEIDPWIRPHFEGRDYNVGNSITALPNCIGYMYPSLVEFGTGKNVRTKTVRRIRWQQVRHPETDAVIMAKDQLQVFGESTDDLDSTKLHELVMSRSTATNGRPRRR